MLVGLCCCQKWRYPSLGWSDKRMSHPVSLLPGEISRVGSAGSSTATYSSSPELFQSEVQLGWVESKTNLPPSSHFQLGLNWAERFPLLSFPRWVSCSAALQPRSQRASRFPWLSECSAHSCRYKRTACSHLYKEGSSDGLRINCLMARVSNEGRTSETFRLLRNMTHGLVNCLSDFPLWNLTTAHICTAAIPAEVQTNKWLYMHLHWNGSADVVWYQKNLFPY